MRLALVLLLVFASTECYNVTLYNGNLTPITVYANILPNGIVLPAATPSPFLPSKWTLTGQSAQTGLNFQMENLVATIQPTTFPQNPPVFDVTASYVTFLHTDTTIGMKLQVPGHYSNEGTLSCNLGPDDYPKACVVPPNYETQPIQTITIPYVDGEYEIWYNQPMAPAE